MLQNEVILNCNRSMVDVLQAEILSVYQNITGTVFQKCATQLLTVRNEDSSLISTEDIVFSMGCPSAKHIPH